MLGEAPLAQQFSRELFEARRVRHGDRLPNRAAGQGAHPRDDLRRPPKDDLDKGLEAFKTVGKKLGVI